MIFRKRKIVDDPVFKLNLSLNNKINYLFFNLFEIEKITTDKTLSHEERVKKIANICSKVHTDYDDI